MRFTEAEIQLARQLRDQGLAWEPRAGHYVLDPTEFCQQASPFQDRVYFILNYPYFMKTVGGVERFKEIMIWLPTWQDAREILRGLGVSDRTVARYLEDGEAIAVGSERLALYELISQHLKSRATRLSATSGD